MSRQDEGWTAGLRMLSNRSDRLTLLSLHKDTTVKLATKCCCLATEIHIKTINVTINIYIYVNVAGASTKNSRSGVFRVSFGLFLVRKSFICALHVSLTSKGV